MTLTAFAWNISFWAYIPHGHCYFWQPGLVLLHALSDGLIALAYFSIPIALVYFVQRRQDLPYPWLFWLFGAFILTCGLTHFMEVWTLWYPTYWISGAIKAVTAIFSIATAFTLIPVIPVAITLPSRSELETANARLEEQVRDRTQSLQRSKERLNLAVRSANIGIWDWNIVGDRLVWDERMYDLYGIRSEEFDGSYSAWKARLHPDDLGASHIVAQQALAGERDYETEFRVVWPDGSVRWLAAYGLIQRDAAGKPLRMTGVNLDITERKQAEENRIQTEKLRLEFHLLETILDTVLAGYWDWHIPEHYCYMSPNLKRIFGYEDHELPNVPEAWRSLVLADDLPEVQTCFDRHVASRGEVPYYSEVRCQHRDGSTIWVICAGQVLDWDEAGQPLRMVGCHVDITKQKQTEEQLRLLSDRLTLALQAGAIGTWDWNLVHDAIWDQRMYEIYGLQDLERPVTYQDWVERVHPEDLAPTEVALEAAIRGERDFDVEFRIRRTDGELCWVQAIAMVQRDSEDRPLRMIGINRDITNRRQAEEQILRTSAQLEASNRELEAFAYSVSHDLRSPLRAIDGFSKALLEDYGDQFDAEATDYFNRIRHNIQRMGMLIDDLLRLSRISRSEMRQIQVNLSELVSEQAQELQAVEPQRQVEFVIAPEVFVAADPTLMRIVVNNLLNNAWKFTSHHATARIEFGIINQNGEMAHYIRDDGAGFDMAYASKLFGVFQRLHDTDEFPGTGIGLAIVQRAVHRHGGRVWAEAAIEQGATFYFTLPGSVMEAVA
ncbi:MAG: PAS domain-containing protein [Elainellaceae cyanobacterium]